MKKAITLLLSTLVMLLTTACKDSVNLNQLSQNPSKLVVYAFPSENDTIQITISATYPISGNMPTLYIEDLNCTTNGIADRIISLNDTITGSGIPIARFAAIGSHNSGDNIYIKVKANGFAEAYGSSIIPERPTIQNARLDTLSFKGVNYPAVRLTMHDNKSTPFYATRIEGKHNGDSYYNDFNNTKGYNLTQYMPLIVAAEPLLSNSSNIDLDLSDWDSNFYRYIYNFDNSSFVGNKATLHLYIATWLNEFCDYRPHLLALSPEYNNMLRSLNDISNNDFGKYGLAFAYSTYTNVHGGYGCIGAYAEVVGEWMR